MHLQILFYDLLSHLTIAAKHFLMVFNIISSRQDDKHTYLPRFENTEERNTTLAAPTPNLVQPSPPPPSHPAPPPPRRVGRRRELGCSASSEHVCTSGGTVTKINVMLSVRTPPDISSVYPNNLEEPSGDREPHSAVRGRHLTF